MQITSVAGHWAVLDATERMLRLDGHEVDLSANLGPSDDPVLQEPAVTGDSIVIAHRRGLLSVGLDGGEPKVLEDEVAGAPAAPVLHDGCLHAAWASGEAWRSCPDAGAQRAELDDATGAGDFAFLVNGDTLVLNDAKSGKTWAASDDYGLIDNWDALLADERDEETVEQNDPDMSPARWRRARFHRSPIPDEFGARPGRSTLLPVLLNDYDANGDVLVVDGVDGGLPAGARLDRVSDNQQLQLTLDDGASGTVSFGYTVGDGRGGAAHATVERDRSATPTRTRRPCSSARPGRRSRAVGG